MNIRKTIKNRAQKYMEIINIVEIIYRANKVNKNTKTICSKEN